MFKRILCLFLFVNALNVYSQNNNEIILLESILYKSTKTAEEILGDKFYGFLRSKNMYDRKVFFFSGKDLVTTGNIGYMTKRGREYVEESFVMVNSSKKCQILLDQIKKRGARLIRTRRGENNSLTSIYHKRSEIRYLFYTEKNNAFCQVKVSTVDEEEEQP